MATRTWNIDPTHSGIHFSVRHMVVAKVRGTFKTFSGTVRYDSENPEQSSAEVNIDAAGIDTGVEQRDGHLRSADFLDAEKFPTLAFVSSKIEKAGANLRVTGNLTIRDITRGIVLDVEPLGGGKDPWGNERIAFAAKTSVNRTEFGLVWNQALEAGGVLVGEKIEIELEVQAVAASAEKAA